MKLKGIFNPAAGRGRVKRSLARLKADWHRHYGDAPYALTESADDTEQKTRAALKEGFDRIFAVGGDGTLNRVANGFFEDGKPINPSATLALSDWGTGSDYFRGVFAGSKRDPFDVAEQPNVRPVDVCQIEWAENGRRHFFLNASTIGLGAEVVRRREALSPAVPALLAYALPTLTALFDYRPQDARVTMDGQVFDGSLFTVFLAKGQFAGGGMRLGAKAQLDDGLLDVTIVRGMPLWRTLPRLPKLYTGNFENDLAFVKAKAARIEIRSATPLPVEADGDPLGHTEILVTVHPRALKVCFP